jgi:ribonuclease BN (tRNA processing enzyme)
MASAPGKVTIRSYHVGFGDCFLLSFQYAAGEKHVLIDFGSTGVPKGVALGKRMMDIALDIKARTNGKLDAVVATHRHKDHISGFETKADGKGTGDVIRSLKPDLVVQPWTEDPDLAPDATGPKDGLGAGTGNQVAALAQMHNVADATLRESKATRYFSAAVKEQLSFLGETNINNPSAVKNLKDMAENDYVYCGKKTKLANILPGVKIDVLGPPTVKQTEKIKRQRSNDPDEFWQLQARAMHMAGTAKAAGQALFPRFVRSRGPTFPIDTRWLIYHAKTTHAAQVLQIVRMLDTAMNNTSVILTFQVGKTSLLFPGDAQIENWQFALEQDKYKELLANVDLYKVGHHGSRNATPKSLWGMFKNKSTQASAAGRLRSLMSTMEHKHGSEVSHTEVPRSTLVSELKRQSDLFSTQQLSGRSEIFHDTVLEFAGGAGSDGAGRGGSAKPRRKTRRPAR